MKKFTLSAGLAVACFAMPASANPILYAMNEKPHCLEEVANSETLHVKSLKRVGSSGVRMTIKQSKRVKAKAKDFRTAKAAFTACMAHRLEAHSVTVE
ncbi:hypothetical protein RA19_04060 [Leisingera sp. ANG-M1]|uniref:hypothetical protein n=1 Tax=Leisingera sp. ANG-M1 TaxID=1577895 RepID=UPI00057D26C1|nr:hypothetical protein [Leisingera sp. ANG-M1]KIC11819.1 hypothetical protein RA19_04060 [Leisingera sp. ANG-M1]